MCGIFMSYLGFLVCFEGLGFFFFFFGKRERENMKLGDQGGEKDLGGDEISERK